MSGTVAATRPAGERRCAADTREALLRAARRHFSVHGYAGATLRAIAAEADVSAALLVKYFGSKEGLLTAAADLEAETAALLDAPNADLGRHLVAALLDMHDRAQVDPLLRVVLTGPRPGGERIVEELERRLVGPLAARLAGPDARLRAELVCAQLIGLGALRLLLTAPGMVAESPAALVDRLGPILQAWIDPPA
ncbi:regulatory protein TetR [Pseudonocardia dioxanivorans CB1190]|uniref:Regulatory protein TetR n=1 Tax=Pseudonocardia dioxanivorans (strain ATCC 55486 / DSM 44775 / JCM 13855 / CB1190) TaxID=675635 RepID=F4CVJ7_PSEUX|nr:TetR/AcrR family transcriptional regulator [Pseudonocardia dioxanivorans]AEA23817.1 regulatory protein TetR [Pseudonocardia dioxanivorans CB1190]